MSAILLNLASLAIMTPSTANSEYSCSERITYIQRKLKSATSPTKLLNLVAIENPRLLIVGDTHDVSEFHAYFWNKLIRDYKAVNPKLDCVFLESPPDKAKEAIYNEGRNYFIKYGMNYIAALRAFAKESGLTFTVTYNSINSSTFKIGDVYVDTQDLQLFYGLNLKRFSIDERTDLTKRDEFMTQYSSQLMTTGVCNASVAFLGKGHLRPQKKILTKLGIKNFTLVLENSNPYQTKYFGPEGIVTNTLSALDDIKCSFPQESVPKLTVGILTRDEASPLINSWDSLQLRWSDFDGHIIMPVSAMQDY